MPSLFADYCKIIGIQKAKKSLGKLGPLTFINNIFIPAFYKAAPFTNIDAYNPDSRSNYFHGWKGFSDGSYTFSDSADGLVNMFMRKQGGMCFQRGFFLHLLFNEVGIENYMGTALTQQVQIM